MFNLLDIVEQPIEQVDIEECLEFCEEWSMAVAECDTKQLFDIVCKAMEKTDDYCDKGVYRYVCSDFRTPRVFMDRCDDVEGACRYILEHGLKKYKENV